MEKIILSLAIILLSVTGFTQVKKDTTIQITLSLNDFRALLYTIDANVDSKKTSKEIMDFLQKSAAIKPKEDKK